MNNVRRYYRHILIIFLLTGIFTATTAQPPVNLLLNPGFEDGFRTLDGTPPREVALGWTPWHNLQQAQPEYYAASAAPTTPRVFSGGDAQSLYSFFSQHDGGIFQRVSNITPGTELLFSIYAYIWSSNGGDVNISEGSPQVSLEVGIDPTGGTDPTSSAIVWSVAISNQYDAYRQYSIRATAGGNAVTVFVRSNVIEPLSDSWIFIDEAVLAPTVGSVPQQPATNTPIPAATTAPSIDPTPTQEIGIIIPTETPVPTNTPIPAATSTPIPTATIPPTATDLPPATPTLPPTATIIPPTATEPPPPTPTQEILPTNTPIPAATNTPAPIVTPTTAFGTGGAVVSGFPGSLVHRVRRGDTVGRLSILYGSTNEAIAEANQLGEDLLIFVGQGLVIPVPLAAPATSTPTQTPIVIIVTATPAPALGQGGPITQNYTVRPGETLSGIAFRFGVSLTALAQQNGITNINLIQAGQVLRIPASTPVSGDAPPPPPAPPTPQPPAPTTHIVQPGENLYRISLRYGVSMAALAQANGILNYNFLFTGQALQIP